LARMAFAQSSISARILPSAAVLGALGVMSPSFVVLWAEQSRGPPQSSIAW
jgi:hypothetical protein